MEHKLILGGEQYLPFARSRIKALRAMGLTHASQQFEVDGVSIKVRTDGEHNFIRIGGGSCVFGLDNGVVPLDGVNKAYETAYAASYNKPFVLASGESKSRTFDGPSAGQISGSITMAGGIKGRVPVDAEPSKAFLDTTEDQAQKALKQATIASCPASIFTGKCRQYVQAMYGLPLYINSKAVKLPQVVAVTTAAPALLVAAYKKPSDKTEYQDVMVGTSSGVVLNSDGTHWLMNFVNSDSIHIFPLVGNECAEKLRSYLVIGSDGKYPEDLSQEDRDHIEAYILSTCLPDRTRMQTLSLGMSIGQYSMGYGWHWKFSSPTADIVVSDTFLYDGFNSAMRSTHYRVDMRIVDGVWAVSPSIVEGPKEWSVLRSAWCITEPNFAKRVLTKSTPKLAVSIECDAPFYAFYKKDTLTVARIKVVKKNESAYRTMTPNFATSTAFGGANNTYSSLGLLDGWLEDHSAVNNSYEATITIGGFSSDLLPYARTDVVARSEVVNKQWPKREFSNGFYSDYGQWLNQSYPVGYPLPGGSYTMSGAVNCNQVKTDWKGLLTYELNKSTTTTTTNGSAAVVIPLFDSEAAFCWSNKSERDTGSVTRGTWGAGYIGDSPVRMNGVITNGDLVWTEYVYYQYANAGGAYSQLVVVPEYTTPIDVTRNSVKSKLVCQAGVVEAKFTSMQQFFNNDSEEVEQTFPTWSGVRVDEEAVVLSANTSATGFRADVPIDIPAVLGWV
jgi:hypothetical protein